ncbi:MAG TPA: hypothetical protein VHL11_00830 [Phototrophicaceae bacterium]|nr:hypothetical protein [Phototrophicaceae bacterium]
MMTDSIQGKNQTDFWMMLDSLVESSEIMIDRPRGSTHPRFEGWVYPLDYGYLAGTTANDGGGIDIWIGSGEQRVVGIINTIDFVKRDAEIKILLGCTEAEIEMVLAFFDQSEMGCLAVIRPTHP